ncbi:hypothetical protein M9458_020795 [Cirrhinus mrigala]|uniref:O-methyltransferase dimerisation domain-containing protein n=1 Tax=Cirrhinus mrigala TaxID=683832 RepID=A0ABD0QG64_CIRMR
MGVFEQLHESQRPLSVSELAAALGCSEDGTERLLNACVSLELLNANADPHGTGHSSQQHILIIIT